jgi:hypothetical protein
MTNITITNNPMSVTTAILRMNCIGVEVTLTLHRWVKGVDGDSNNSSEKIKREQLLILMAVKSWSLFHIDLYSPILTKYRSSTA